LLIVVSEPFVCVFRKGRYEVDGYVYSKDEEPKLLVTGKWNTSMSYQPCDEEGEPLPGTDLKEIANSKLIVIHFLEGQWSCVHFDSLRKEHLCQCKVISVNP
jgi:hypothetical protein